MLLYFTPFTCSLAVHIALREAGLSFELEKVDAASKVTASGADFRAVNPLGYVPVLVLDDGTSLTEVSSILQWVADRAPGSGLAPAAGTPERYQLQSWLNFIATEVHKLFSTLFHPKAPPEWKEVILGQLRTRLDHLEPRLAAAPYLMGESLTIADLYLFVVLGWTRAIKFDLAPWPALQAFVKRVAERPTVKESTGLEKQRLAAG
ncbi:MAG: glutathione transferase GstA [Myxococcales bacterium]|nr:glutathione transferase GstA [Myxococcales bacterium]